MADQKRGDEQLDDDDLNEFFTKLQEVVSAIVRRLDEKSSRTGDPFVYGLQIKVGSDGSPHVQEFGDPLPPLDRLITGKREPLTDVCETEDEISITIEIPGVIEEHMETRCEGTKLIVSVDSGNAEYYKEIDLKSEIDHESMTVTYVNGVLDINFKKLKQPDRRGKTEENNGSSKR